MIRDVTGLNEARDGSMPDKDALVGLQKMAANASNTATKHILQSSLWLTLRTCENISLKIADSLNYPLTLESLKSSISTYNVGTLSEIQNLNLHDFGIYLELEPEEEDKAMLEQQNHIIIVGSDIIYNDNPGETAKEYAERSHECFKEGFPDLYKDIETFENELESAIEKLKKMINKNEETN